MNVAMWRLGFIVVGLVAVFGYGAIEARREMAIVVKLQPKLAELLAFEGRRTADPPRLAGRKVVCVCVTERDFDASEYRLPTTLRALVPREVSAIVRVARREEQVGTYGDAASPALRRWADVEVIDVATREIIAARTFVGSDPPPRGRRGEPGLGSKPIQEIDDWLSSL